jgi:hypothetical protein
VVQLKLENEFEMNNLEELHSYLGVEFERKRELFTITMNQRSYIEGFSNISTWKNANLLELHSMQI